MNLADTLSLAPEDTAIEILNQLGSIGNWLQALGIIFILWIIFQVANYFINARRIKKLNAIESRLEELESKLAKKIDKINKKLT